MLGAFLITPVKEGIRSLSGIDLGNMLIKRVARLLQSELPSIQIHSTLSPIPGFRTWMLRTLHGSSLSGSLIDEITLQKVSEFKGETVTVEQATEILLHNTEGTVSEEPS
ncbi:hypothetical protein DICVIV_01143 [Dictyocaulus viviparus]|uniref:Malonyl-CoA decarboxylase C-terminal domain-containing protein n=1 Tax=Dictyocaulus viviparus TaxID=29172 RepID=A0A0D8Y914_DICVI|nr:hypothetical protein DICVIV_01143 [Dictyocaulus viviparus]